MKIKHIVDNLHLNYDVLTLFKIFQKYDIDNNEKLCKYIIYKYIAYKEFKHFMKEINI